jgi:hypothetical protein
MSFGQTEPTIHVAVTAWKRPDCLRHTLESFWRFNRAGLEGRQWRAPGYRLWFGLDGGVDVSVTGELLALFGAHGFAPLVTEDANVGVARITADLIAAIARLADPADWVLLLQDDWESVRPVPLGVIRELMDRPEVANIRLYGRYRERDEAGRPTRPVGQGHEGLPGKPPIHWHRETILSEEVLTGRAYWAHPPSLTRIGVAVHLTNGATDEKESFRRSGEADYVTAWLTEPVFYHIGRESCWRDLGGKR